MASGTALDRFLSSFVVPLTSGGKVEVDGLLGPGALHDMVHGAKGAAMVHVDGKLMADAVKFSRAHITRIGPCTDFVTLTPDAIGLALVWHNLLAMTHPEASSKTSLRRKVRVWTHDMLAWIGPPRTAHEISIRHGVLANLTQLGRVDTHVEFWAGKGDYIGISPPKMTVAWKGLRRVQESKVRVSFLDLVKALESPHEDAELLSLAHVALAYSPLTDLSLCERGDTPFPFQWSGPSLSLLADASLRGASMRLLAGHGERGTDGVAGRVALLERATLIAVAQQVPPESAQLLLALHLELLVSEALSRGAAPTGHALAWDALIRMRPDRAARVAGLEPELVVRALGLDEKPRSPAKEAPSLPLLQRAGFA